MLHRTPYIVIILLFHFTSYAQFAGQWLDIGAYHEIYAESGAKKRGAPGLAEGMEYPAILRRSSHNHAKAFWIGVKDWSDPQGHFYPYYVSRIGPTNQREEYTFPVQNKLIGRYQDTIVEVDGLLSTDNEAGLDEIDPDIAADRMIYNIHNMTVGITTHRKIYAYTNHYHDNNHIIDYTHCNTGNTDGDEEIELPDQDLHDVYFFRIHRWRGNEQAAWVGSGGQVWGKFTMIDVVGDGHADYPVDFMAQWAWYGWNWNLVEYSSLGSPLFYEHWTMAEGDTVGRLSGPTMAGRSTIHADRSTTDTSYDRDQPTTIGWIDPDGPILYPAGHPDPTHKDYYELGILTRENPARNPGCITCYTRMYPHYADRIEPGGEFWNPTGDPAAGKDGGHAATNAFGPYEMGPGECVNIVVSEGVAGLSFDAATKIGRAYKRSGDQRDRRIIEFDADGNGVIAYTPFDYDRVFVGTEAQTKNQWVMSARDSLFQMFYRARDLYAASDKMTRYPIAEPPRPPVRFSVRGRPDRIDLAWTPASGGPDVDHWELYRTDKWEDNLYVNGCLQNLSIPCGYVHVADLPACTTSYADTDVSPGVDYFYYLEGVGASQPVNPDAIHGTPGGVPLRSGRYLTQTYHPVSLSRQPYGPSETVADARVVPNPVNLGSDQFIRFAEDDRLDFLDIPGECTIRIFTEIGELVKTIEHTDGSGDESWNLTTNARQLVVSGIYIAVIEDLGSGERAFLKFSVIR